MRIIGGRHKGRSIVAPKDAEIRPTSDRVREALFNILAHTIDDFEITGAHVLDLFAGTGALGFEALSRGAASCVFVENAAVSRALIQENASVFGFGGTARIFRRDATDLGRSTQSVLFDLVFADPPYDRGLGEQAVASAMDGGWLAQGALIVIEESANATVALPSNAELVDHRHYADTQIMIARYIT